MPCDAFAFHIYELCCSQISELSCLGKHGRWKASQLTYPTWISFTDVIVSNSKMQEQRSTGVLLSFQVDVITVKVLTQAQSFMDVSAAAFLFVLSNGRLCRSS
jgi:hypothetical protein